MRRPSRILITTELIGALVIMAMAVTPARADTPAPPKPSVWRLVDESTFPEGLPEGFEPMQVPADLTLESYSQPLNRSEHLPSGKAIHICSPHGHAENPHISGTDVPTHGFLDKTTVTATVRTFASILPLSGNPANGRRHVGYHHIEYAEY
ncbi:hypothetical protein GSS87_06620 [Corynebacterium sp. 4HC-13]|uniref:hypothetical protein n=1 Tax=Corynebacterium anserum TaxID=2684406 RepID=UPI00163AD64E|nr:hypothetical protein [Corynebacterium anserum]MBC2682067.1 hypothetical protein [Corynebacterium anserum]